MDLVAHCYLLVEVVDMAGNRLLLGQMDLASGWKMRPPTNPASHHCSILRRYHADQPWEDGLSTWGVLHYATRDLNHHGYRVPKMIHDGRKHQACMMVA